MLASLFSAEVSAALSGFFVSFSLILAIGAQNAFILRQGIRREHVGALVVCCAASDAILICVGIALLEQIRQILPGILPWMLYGGVAFLGVYGALRFLAAWRGGEALDPQNGAKTSLVRAVVTALALTWLNPHVYLDTVVFIGGIGVQFGENRWFFGAGAVLASVTFFTSLGFGARFLAPLFARPAAWRWLEAGIGVTMWTIAASLLFGSTPI